MIKPTHRETISLENGKKIKTYGHLATIIDYTLSRIKVKEEDECRIIYRDLKNDDWLFNNNQNEIGQYVIYNQMNQIVKGNWNEFFPQNNISWILYISKYILIKYRPKCLCLENFISRLQKQSNIKCIYEKESFKCENIK